MSKVNKNSPTIDEIKNALLPSIAELFENQTERFEKRVTNELHGVKVLIDRSIKKSLKSPTI
jgi:hypothetical protein